MKWGSQRLILHSDVQYNGNMDLEVVYLCDALNALPSIRTTESCCGHGHSEFRIYFRVGKSKKGLFFLTREIDRRYWSHGDEWGIKLMVGDVFRNGRLPIEYVLHSGRVMGEEAYDQAICLVNNMNEDLNNKVFMSYYNLNIESFKTVERKVEGIE